MRMLYEAGARLWGLYHLVEERLGFHRVREASVASNASWRVSCDSACTAAAAAEAALGGAKACVVGPLAPQVPRDCRVIVLAGEDSLALTGPESVVAALVTDADGRPPVDPGSLAPVVLLHVHADNLHLALDRIHRVPWGRLVATSQVPLPGCVVSPFGFADGDRAILLAAALGAVEVRVAGVDLDPVGEKFRVSTEYIRAVARLHGYTLDVRGRRDFTLKRQL